MALPETDLHRIALWFRDRVPKDLWPELKVEADVDPPCAVRVVGGQRGEAVGWVDARNVQLLLDQVEDVPDEHRGAAFVCAAVLAMPDWRVAATEGRVEGRLARSPRGSNGFRLRPGLPAPRGRR